MQIWKFKVPFNTDRVDMPEGAHILSANTQGDFLMVWARVDPEARRVSRIIRIYGTGHTIADVDVGLSLINTVFMGPLVIHVFDGGEVA